MWDNKKWYQLFEGVILIAQCVHFDIRNKMKKKNFFSATKIRMGGIRNFFWQEIFWKILHFAIYSRYQNVRTKQLKWRVRKVDITSGCLTIMVYFCNNEWVFILTKVQLYCDFVFGNYEISNTFLLLHRAYILISGIKCKKKNFQKIFKKFLAKKNFA